MVAHDKIHIRHIYNLQIGDWVDLEKDAIADRGDHPEFQFEWQCVAKIEHESPTCTRVDFTSGFSCGFPPLHRVPVKA